MHYTD